MPCWSQVVGAGDTSLRMVKASDCALQRLRDCHPVSAGEMTAARTSTASPMEGHRLELWARPHVKHEDTALSPCAARDFRPSMGLFHAWRDRVWMAAQRAGTQRSWRAEHQGR